MGMDYEWATPSDFAGLATPAEIEDLADDGNAAGDYGLAFATGSNGCMIYGSLGDLRALVERITRELDAAEPPLPELPEPAATEDEEQATCPYVYTQADADAVVAANAEYTAKMRAMHGDDANLYPQQVPEVGAVCGADLVLWDKDPVYGRLYTEAGGWICGPRKGGDNMGGDEEVQCDNGHQWAVPDIDDWQ